MESSLQNLVNQLIEKSSLEEESSESPRRLYPQINDQNPLEFDKEGEDVQEIVKHNERYRFTQGYGFVEVEADQASTTEERTQPQHISQRPVSDSFNIVKKGKKNPLLQQTFAQPQVVEEQKHSSSHSQGIAAKAQNMAKAFFGAKFDKNVEKIVPQNQRQQEQNIQLNQQLKVSSIKDEKFEDVSEYVDYVMILRKNKSIISFYKLMLESLVKAYNNDLFSKKGGVQFIEGYNINITEAEHFPSHIFLMTDFERHWDRITKILTYPDGTPQLKFIEDLIQYSIDRHRAQEKPFREITIVSTIFFESKYAQLDAIGIKQLYDQRIQEWLQQKSYRQMVRFEVICVHKVEMDNSHGGERQFCARILAKNDNVFGDHIKDEYFKF